MKVARYWNSICTWLRDHGSYLINMYYQDIIKNQDILPFYICLYLCNRSRTRAILAIHNVPLHSEQSNLMSMTNDLKLPKVEQRIVSAFPTDNPKIE